MSRQQMQLPGAEQPARSRRLRVIGLVVALMIGLSLTAIGPASAQSNVGGAIVSTTISCDAGLHMMNATAESTAGGYVKLWLWDVQLQSWTPTGWYAVTDFTTLISSPFNFGHEGYFYVYAQYAVPSTAGTWLYGGEWITSYLEQAVGGFGTNNVTVCQI